VTTKRPTSIVPLVSGSTVERLDPRVDRTRRAVLEAVAMLVVNEGAAWVTHQRVAEVSGVGRATLYRHWPTPADLLYDALEEAEQPLLRPRDEPLMTWLRAELHRAPGEMAAPTAIQFLAVLIGRADHDPDAAELRRRLIDQDVMNLAIMVARAEARGEIVGHADPHDLYSKLLGPLLIRTVIEGRPASDRFIDDVIDTVMAPWLPVPGHTNSETN
jgi:AcrR family transcriptional regulator